MSDELRIVTFLIKPWNDLNALLAQPFAFQPDFSDVTRLAGSLAVDINHQADNAGTKPVDVAKLSQPCSILRDVADAWKHGKLKVSSRDNTLAVTSRFECLDDGTFRFMRNVVLIEHASLGQIDFMTVAGQAIVYWMNRLRVWVSWSPVILENRLPPSEVAGLFFNPKYQFQMSSTRIQTVRLSSSGEYVLFDPPLVKFAVYEMPEETPVQAS